MLHGRSKAGGRDDDGKGRAVTEWFERDREKGEHGKKCQPPIESSGEEGGAAGLRSEVDSGGARREGVSQVAPERPERAGVRTR